MNISVWAPYAHCLELDVPASRVPMLQQPHGWWSVFVDTDSSIEYAFVVDGGDPLPDPRSAWQPFGVHGPSRPVDALHGAGLAAILDVVYNHLGPSGNYLSRFGPYFTGDLRTPWGDAVNLGGPGSLEVRAFLIENALMWLRDYHFDGLRLDAVHALVDASAIHFLEELGLRVEDLGRELSR